MRRILLVFYSAVFGDHRVKPIGRRQCQQIAVFYSVPFHESDCEHIVTDQKRSKSMRKVFIQEQLHRAAPLHSPDRVLCTVDLRQLQHSHRLLPADRRKIGKEFIKAHALFQMVKQRTHRNARPRKTRRAALDVFVQADRLTGHALMIA